MYGVANTELENEKNNFYYSKINKGKNTKISLDLTKNLQNFLDPFRKRKAQCKKANLALFLTDNRSFLTLKYPL